MDGTRQSAQNQEKLRLDGRDQHSQEVQDGHSRQRAALFGAQRQEGVRMFHKAQEQR